MFVGCKDMGSMVVDGRGTLHHGLFAMCTLVFGILPFGSHLLGCILSVGHTLGWPRRLAQTFQVPRPFLFRRTERQSQNRPTQKTC